MRSCCVWIVYQIVQFVRVVYEVEILLSSAFVVPDVLILPGHNKMVAEIAAAVFAVYERMGARLFAAHDGTERQAV